MAELKKIPALWELVELLFVIPKFAKNVKQLDSEFLAILILAEIVIMVGELSKIS